MLTYSMTFEAKLRQMLEESIEEIKEAMSRGHVTDYRQMVGKVEGLRHALELCSEVSMLLNSK